MVEKEVSDSSSLCVFLAQSVAYNRFSTGTADVAEMASRATKAVAEVATVAVFMAMDSLCVV